MVKQWQARPVEMRVLLVLALVLEVAAFIAFEANHSPRFILLVTPLVLGIVLTTTVWDLSRRHG